MPCLLYALSFHFRSSRVTNKGYFNTGHKVTFGLGQTQLGWGREDGGTSGRGNIADPISIRAESIATRARELAPFFLDLKKRQGGERASKSAKLWAQIIARLEIGESLKSIAIDLNLPYDTVKKYAQVAKKQLQSAQS
jgi:CRISPR-associated endoribonuclease Cas6